MNHWGYFACPCGEHYPEWRFECQACGGRELERVDVKQPPADQLQLIPPTEAT